MQEEYRRCRDCALDLPVASFPYTRQRTDRINPRCRECHNAWKRAYARAGRPRGQSANYRLLAELKSKPCTDCGVAYPPYVMHFDHRDPSVKVANISALARGGGGDPMLAEIAKCDLVCANCHAERTHRQRLGRAFPMSGRPRRV